LGAEATAMPASSRVAPAAISTCTGGAGINVPLALPTKITVSLGVALAQTQVFAAPLLLVIRAGEVKNSMPCGLFTVPLATFCHRPANGASDGTGGRPSPDAPGGTVQFAPSVISRRAAVPVKLCCICAADALRVSQLLKFKLMRPGISRNMPDMPSPPAAAVRLPVLQWLKSKLVRALAPRNICAKVATLPVSKFSMPMMRCKWLASRNMLSRRTALCVFNVLKSRITKFVSRNMPVKRCTALVSQFSRPMMRCKLVASRNMFESQRVSLRLM